MAATQQDQVIVTDIFPALKLIWREGLVPLKTHERDRFAADGTPEITDAFASWLSGHRTRTERRTRLGWAMRKLRSASIREYEVAFRAIDQGETVEQTTAWLNERCERNRIDFHYTLSDTLTIRAAALHKLLSWV